MSRLLDRQDVECNSLCRWDYVNLQTGETEFKGIYPYNELKGRIILPENYYLGKNLRRKYIKHNGCFAGLKVYKWNRIDKTKAIYYKHIITPVENNYDCY
jgi:hypothetical protein